MKQELQRLAMISFELSWSGIKSNEIETSKIIPIETLHMDMILF